MSNRSRRPGKPSARFSKSMKTASECSPWDMPSFLCTWLGVGRLRRGGTPVVVSGRRLVVELCSSIQKAPGKVRPGRRPGNPKSPRADPGALHLQAISRPGGVLPLLAATRPAELELHLERFAGQVLPGFLLVGR